VLTPLGFTLLRQLSDGAFHSGEDLAATVGLTRARVSQLLKQAETSGLSLERVRGRGYRLLATPDFLDVGAVRTALADLDVEVADADARPVMLAANDDDLGLPAGVPPGIPRRPPIVVEIVDQLDSTSTELLRRAARRDIHGALLAAEWQSAGRGRRGRSWSAVAGGSLTFSLGWRFEQGAGFMAGLSLAVGVAVVRALEALGLSGVELKWPNDLIHRHLKVGGILVELNGDALGPSTVVVGLGLNVRLPLSVKRDIAQPVSDLTAVAGRGAPPIDRNRLLARLAAELAATLATYGEHGFAPFAAEWQRRHAYQGKAVKLLLPDGVSVKGTVAGVDGTGALVLADGPRRVRFLAGEISLRRA
jgi:BirA family biotin operon repressor/biotin-[acetyl-CoA-carboxylase] ligase